MSSPIPTLLDLCRPVHQHGALVPVTGDHIDPHGFEAGLPLYDPTHQRAVNGQIQRTLFDMDDNRQRPPLDACSQPRILRAL